MDTENTGSSPAKQRAMDWLLWWLVPSLLILIAVQQFYLVRTRDLSPWVGGGFGMFAVIDTVAMRTISGDCIDHEGRPCILYLPIYGEERFIRGRKSIWIRARRDDDLLGEVAELLIDSQWIRTSLHEVAERRDVEGALQRLPPERTSKPIYQLAAERDPPAEKIRLRAIRLQMWKLVFDAEQGVLRPVRWGAAVERGDWP